jgi:hypothetical protein
MNRPDLHPWTRDPAEAIRIQATLRERLTLQWDGKAAPKKKPQAILTAGMKRVDWKRQVGRHSAQNHGETVTTSGSLVPSPPQYARF